jgi:hypothetical protein
MGKFRTTVVTRFRSYGSWCYGVWCYGVCSYASLAGAAQLPDHEALNVIVVSDEVNPNRLSDAELTQPGDISAALSADDSGLNLAADVPEYDSQCIDEALTAIADESLDVVVYFAHRGAHACDGSDRAVEFHQAVMELLDRDGGLVVFHHGLYFDPGKVELLDLIGAQSNSIAWDTSVGQRVFNVSADHFITSQKLQYESTTSFALDGLVTAGDYPYFDNVPDERYPVTDLTAHAVEQAEILFASDSGGQRVLGYTLTGPNDRGRIFAYQPGEYQPNALDDREGPNFQILANGILFVSGKLAEQTSGEEPTSEDPPEDSSVPTPTTTDAGPGEQPEQDAGPASTSEPSEPAAATNEGTEPAPAGEETEVGERDETATGSGADTGDEDQTATSTDPEQPQSSGSGSTDDPSPESKGEQASGSSASPSMNSDSTEHVTVASSNEDDSGCSLAHRPRQLAWPAFYLLATAMLWFRRSPAGGRRRAHAG